MRVRRTGSERFLLAGTLVEYGDDPTWPRRRRRRDRGAVPEVVRHARLPAYAAHPGRGPRLLPQGDGGAGGVGRRGGRAAGRLRRAVGAHPRPPLRGAGRVRARRRVGAFRAGDTLAAGRIPALGVPEERARAAVLREARLPGRAAHRRLEERGARARRVVRVAPGRVGSGAPVRAAPLALLAVLALSACGGSSSSEPASFEGVPWTLVSALPGT